jgi:hypothetical protein
MKVLTPSSYRHVLELWQAMYAAAPRALEDLNFVLGQPPELAAWLLRLRGLALARRGRPADAAATAEKLRERAAGNADRLVSVARCYGLCVRAVEGGKPAAALTAEEQALRKRYAGAAVAALAEAARLNPKAITGLEMLQELDPIRDEEGFQKLVK